MKFATAKNKPAETANAETPAFAINVAPPRAGGDQIEMDDLSGKLIGVLCTSRQENIKTKFGARSITSVVVIAAGVAEPLEGVLFQDYFQKLAIGQWFVGVVAKVNAGDNKMWILDTENLETPEVAAKLKKLIPQLQTYKGKATPSLGV